MGESPVDMLSRDIQLATTKAKPIEIYSSTQLHSEQNPSQLGWRKEMLCYLIAVLLIAAPGKW